jgi:hypothetical protein
VIELKSPSQQSMLMDQFAREIDRFVKVHEKVTRTPRACPDPYCMDATRVPHFNYFARLNGIFKGRTEAQL